MKEFSFTGAWASGIRFFSGAALGHAILLIGLGVLLPIVVQVLLFGRATVMMNAAAPGAAPDRDMVQLVTIAGFVLQTGSFFASWRLGFARGETLGRALLFGLLAGLMVSAGLAVVLVVIGLAFAMITPLVAAAAVMIAFVGLFAIAWTVYAALFAVAVWLLFLVSLAVGAMAGDLTFAATVVGGSGFVWTFLIAASLVLLWLAGRLSCTAVLMAERRSFNVVGAMRESWALTWDDEWRIVRYLALLGLVMAVAMAGVMAAGGAGLVASVTRGSESMGGTVLGILLLALSIPLAYLSVLVPAGIYRELAPADVAAAEVFA